MREAVLRVFAGDVHHRGVTGAPMTYPTAASSTSSSRLAGAGIQLIHRISLARLRRDGQVVRRSRLRIRPALLSV